MPKLSVENVPVSYVNASPGTRAMNVLSGMGLRDIDIESDDDNAAVLTYTIPEGWVDPWTIEELLLKVGLRRIPADAVVSGQKLE